MFRRWVVASAALIVAAAVGFVGGRLAHPRAGPPTARISAPSRTGTISGHLLAVGGPCCLAPRPLSGTIYVSPGAAPSPSTASVTVPVGKDGAYSVAVPPGTYSLIGASPGYQGGQPACSAEKRVTVTAGDLVVADTLCHER